MIAANGAAGMQAPVSDQQQHSSLNQGGNPYFSLTPNFGSSDGTSSQGSGAALSTNTLAFLGKKADILLN